MRKRCVACVAALLLAASLVQAQWGPYPPPYPPPGFPPGFPPPGYGPPGPPPGYGPPGYGPPPMGYGPYGPPMPNFHPQPYPTPPPAVTAGPTRSDIPPPTVETSPPPSDAAPRADAQDNGCGPGCNSPRVPPNQPEIYDFRGACQRPCNQYWLSVEYLHWLVSAAPGVIPLVTTGSTADAIPGAIGQPHTAVLFGNGDINFPGLNGVRATVGGWIDEQNKWGLEVSGFVLENQIVNYSNSSSSVLAVPITVAGSGAVVPNGPNAVPLRNPVAQTNPLNAGSTGAGATVTTGPYTGSVNDTLATQLWGAEANIYYNLFRACGWSADVLFGIRYLNLGESMTLNATSTEIATGASSVYNDRFYAENQFFGSQIGIRASYSYCGWYFGGILKAAIGLNRESENITGSTTQTSAAGATTTFAGGIFTQPSNIGTFQEAKLSVIPQATLQIGYEFSPNVRVFIAYDFLYWTNVIRAGNQASASINPSQAYGGTLTGPANPSVLFNQSNFFAQGLSAGILFSF